MSFYDIFLINEYATQDEIDDAYNKKIKWLEEKGFSQSIVRKLYFKENVDYAYKVLSDPDSRHDYDIHPEKYRTFDWYLGF